MSVDLDRIARELGARSARRGRHLQSLWGGYGELFRIELTGAPFATAVVKWARPPHGAPTDASFVRKCRSFDVETAFYQHVAPRCDDTCRVPTLRWAHGDRDAREWLLVLEDLDAAGFTVRVDEASDHQLATALAWLASLHARFLGETVDGVWPAGTYWQLDTRRDELAAITDPALRAAADLVHTRLGGGRFHTLLHGDPKEANFCFTRAGTDVAAVDFQYTGAGCAMRDVAYLLYGRGDEPDDGIDEARLALYFDHLRRALARRPAQAAAIDARAVEAEWRALYPLARLDFCRFLAGWRPALWRADTRGQAFVRAQLARL